MNRRWLPLIAGALILTGMAVLADEPPADQGEPPVRLKKKNKPNDPTKPPMVEEKDDKKVDKKDDKKDDKKAPEKPEAMPDKDGLPIGDDEDEKEILERIGRNMKASEDKIANKELDDATRQTQEDIIKDLDALIKMSENGGGDDNQDQQNNAGENKGGQQQQKQQGQRQANRSGKQRSGQRMAGRQRGQQQQQQARNNPSGQPNQGNQNPMGDQKPGNTGNNPGAGANQQAGPLNRDADLFKDPWGHLPETLRAQMNAYGNREKYMDKHQELIKQYYRILAAQGQGRR
jgi:hypothetical protein